ncbi:zinc-binding dehydrogenase [Kutzneria buriramensis]|uniref:L-idonate 5-dehydrogenase n=1 Tax=Kutzneria buriramensis TaxID=1045776 RepID=A0A3E0GXF0_9PSEU|nr:alcohol dehydrogenase catalytic domain-containing protein [Kutzneria buriramensis]REH32647.1 L-idonate 5-dehydrogenase [Kutzneria buriramensis]
MRLSQLVGPRTSKVVELPDPAPAADQVLVEVLACGVCTSDLSAWQDHDSGSPPTRLGHEIAGRIAAVGSDATRWSVGDLVTGLGGEGFASRAVMDAHTVLPIPVGIEPAHALGEPVAVLEEALSRSPITAGSRVAVVGLGFMGLGLVQLAKRHAPGLLVGVDPDPARRGRALSLGADATYGLDDLPADFDVVLEATGVTPGLTTAGSLVRSFGTLNVIGYHHSGDAKMDMNLWYKAVTVVNGFCPDRTRTIAAMATALDLIAQRRFSYAPLVTHRYRLDQVDEAFAAMEAAGPGFVKAVVGA